MRKNSLLFLTTGLALVAACALLWILPRGVHGQTKAGYGFAAVPGEKGGWDLTGPYQVVPGWPKPMSQLPGHEKWGWGAVEGIFAESPNHIFIAQRGELPALTRPVGVPVPQFGPSLSFPVGQVPFRNASQGPVAALPGGGAPGQLPEDADKYWKGTKGVDARWEHNLVAVPLSNEFLLTFGTFSATLTSRPYAAPTCHFFDVCVCCG